MPSKDQMRSVGESCSEYDASSSQNFRSCETCNHWAGEQRMCNLDIFIEQLQNLDQT